MNYLKFPLGTLLLLLSGCAHFTKQSGDKEIASKQLPPKLIKPVARRIWIEPQILENGAVYVDGHFKYIIQKESAWTK